MTDLKKARNSYRGGSEEKRPVKEELRMHLYWYIVLSYILTVGQPCVKVLVEGTHRKESNISSA